MIDLLKKFFDIIIHRKQEIKQTRHFRNLMRGPKIYLNGKPYVKVKLRFVDTLSFDITKHLDQLETEIESQKNVLEKLLSLKTNYEKKIDSLQILKSTYIMTTGKRMGNLINRTADDH